MKYRALLAFLLCLVVSFSWGWPGGAVDTTDVDAATDDPSQARADIHDAFNKLNDIIDDRAVANGVASLDGSGDVPAAQLDNVPTSSATTQGLVELATDAETTTGTDTARAITPSNHNAFHGRGALACLSSNQSIANATDVTINFGAEDYDTNGIHDNATNNSRLTVPSGVTKVRLMGQMSFDTNSTGVRKVDLRRNGSSTFAGRVLVSYSTASSGRTYMQWSSPIMTVSGHYFEIRAYQDSGGSLNIVGDADCIQTWFAMEIIE